LPAEIFKIHILDRSRNAVNASALYCIFTPGENMTKWFEKLRLGMETHSKCPLMLVTEITPGVWAIDDLSSTRMFKLHISVYGSCTPRFPIDELPPSEIFKIYMLVCESYAVNASALFCSLYYCLKYNLQD